MGKNRKKSAKSGRKFKLDKKLKREIRDEADRDAGYLNEEMEPARLLAENQEADNHEAAVARNEKLVRDARRLIAGDNNGIRNSGLSPKPGDTVNTEMVASKPLPAASNANGSGAHGQPSQAAESRNTAGLTRNTASVHSKDHGAEKSSEPSALVKTVADTPTAATTHHKGTDAAAAVRTGSTHKDAKETDKSEPYKSAPVGNTENSSQASPSAASEESVERHEVAQSGSGSDNDTEPANSGLATHASLLLAMAAGVGILMIAAALGLPDGQKALEAIGGLVDAVVPARTAQIVFALDTLFPVFYGAGIVLFASSFQSSANHVLVRMVVLAALIAVIADFGENALVYQVMTGGEPVYLRWPLTVIKYGALVAGGVVLSGLMPIRGFVGGIVHIILRYIFPPAVALLLAGLGGEMVRQIVGAGFVVVLLVMAIYASLFVDERPR